jgi:hypothetical protein
MPKLDTVTVLHTTARDDNAGSTANFELEIERPGSPFRKDFPAPMDNRQPGRSWAYTFDVRGQRIDSDHDEFVVIMRMVDSTDGWLPLSIYVIGQTSTGETILLGDHPAWSPDDWFDRGPHPTPAGPEQHIISGGFSVMVGGD